MRRLRGTQRTIFRLRVRYAPLQISPTKHDPSELIPRFTKGSTPFSPVRQLYTKIQTALMATRWSTTDGKSSRSPPIKAARRARRKREACKATCRVVLRRVQTRKEKERLSRRAESASSAAATVVAMLPGGDHALPQVGTPQISRWAVWKRLVV